MTTVGLISDTHGLLRPEIADIFRGASAILHAGDVGGGAILPALSAIAPVYAVYGNVDDPHDPMLARERSVTFEGVTIHVSHGHELGSPTGDRVLDSYAAAIVVFGHTHRAVVLRRDARLAVNPGAAGPRRFDLKPSVALLRVDARGSEVEIISLG